MAVRNLLFPGLDAAAPEGDVCRLMRHSKPRPPRIARPRILLPSVPLPMRRLAGMWLLGLTTWMAAILALFR